LTSRVDRCSFIIRKYGTTTYTPDLGNEVIVQNGGTTIFGGVITEINEVPAALDIIGYKIECIDYTRLLDGQYVSEVFENQPLNTIIDSLVSRWASGFTTTNVTVTDTVDYINFNYQPISKCLKRLADMFNYDWYVDYSKDIHFF